MTTPILVTGSDGMLGSAVVRVATAIGVSVVGLPRQLLDIADRNQITEVLARYPGATVINCAGLVRERVEADPIRTAWVNSVGPKMLAFSADRMVQVSTDCVFDGAITEGTYNEDSPPCPPDRYGRSKLFGEVIEAPHLTVRVSFIGLGQRGLVQWLLSQPQGAEVSGYTNWLWNGWTAAAFADILVKLAHYRDLTGLVHVPGPEVVTKGWLLKEVAKRIRPDLTVVETEAPEGRRMILATNGERFPAPLSMWQMVEALGEEYRAMQS